MANWTKDGVRFQNPLRVGETLVFNPTPEQLQEAGYQLTEANARRAKTTFTKLQIRRALRALGQEAVLDAALAADEQAQKDWNDAQEISLEDAVFKKALEDQGITEQQIHKIIIQIWRSNAD